MEAIWIVLIILIVAAPFALWFLYLKPRKKREAQEYLTKNLDIAGVPDKWLFTEQTPGGMTVMWNSNPFGSEAEKQLAFECFDTGWKNAFNAMSPKFPTWDFNNRVVNIGIIEGNDKAADGSEAIRTKSGVKAAGACIGTGDGYPLLCIIIPSQKPNGWRYTDLQMRVVWHEIEHYLEYLSDSEVFLRYSGRIPEFPDYHPHHSLPPDVPEIPAPQPLGGMRNFLSVKSSPKCAGAKQ